MFEVTPANTCLFATYLLSEVSIPFQILAMQLAPAFGDLTISLIAFDYIPMQKHSGIVVARPRPPLLSIAANGSVPLASSIRD